MRIIEPTAAIAVDHPVILIVGQWGIGKTSLGTSLNTLLLDFDQGASRAQRSAPVAVVTQWSDVDTRESVFHGFDAVTIDTVEGCLQMLAADILARHPNCGSHGELNPRGWGLLKRRFAAFLQTLQGYGKDILLLAHAKDLRDGDHVRTVARIPGGSYHEIMRIAHVVAHLHLVNGRRVLDATLTDRFPSGKNPGQWPALEIPPADQARAFMRELFDQTRHALGAAQATSARVLESVDQWAHAIGAYRTIDDFTRGLAELRAIKTAHPSVYAQAYQRFVAAAKAAGMKYTGDGGFRFVGRPQLLERPSAAEVSRPATYQPSLTDVGF